MNILLAQKENIFHVKFRVDTRDPTMFTHHIVNNCPITSNTVSVVMTSSNRSKQTYFTLMSMVKSKCKDVQIIIVDDSTEDPILLNVLKNYPFYIDLIQINRATKNWHNPLVNYNIGFQFIQGSKVVIQNAEVCHIGDVLNFVSSYTIDNQHYSFDVKATLDFDANEEIYKSDIETVDIYNREHLFSTWYQCAHNNRYLHFLTAMTRETFNHVGGFSYDCAMGVDYDDDDLLLIIQSKGISLINIFHTNHNIGGIHLYHQSAYISWAKDIGSNKSIFDNKKRVYNQTGEYIDATSDINTFDTKYQQLLS